MKDYFNDERSAQQIAEDKARHEKVKKSLKIIGAVLALCGLVLTVIAFVSFFSAFNDPEGGMPKLFFLAFVGMPMLGIGAAMLSFAFHREVGRYVKNESMPFVKEAGEELAPTVGKIADAVRGKSTVKCAYCHTDNDADGKFCKNCGKLLGKTCEYCGATVDSDSEFCKNCGRKL